MELEAVKELVDLVKECIEKEAKLPHELILSGEHFSINNVLMVEPPPEPRPGSPMEKACRLYMPDR